MDNFTSKSGKKILSDLIEIIQKNVSLLSEIDGAIGDGDHGINMNKGFTKAQQFIGDNPIELSEALDSLGNVLITEIGGAMGPLYGTFFIEMASACKGVSEIDRELFGKMLECGYRGILNLGNAKVGDKTLVDTLDPAIRAYQEALMRGENFSNALKEMVTAAEKGKESTRDLVARVGRASRLGDRSKGVLDAGATSCFLILSSMANSIQQLIKPIEECKDV